MDWKLILEPLQQFIAMFTEGHVSAVVICVCAYFLFKDIKDQKFKSLLMVAAFLLAASFLFKNEYLDILFNVLCLFFVLLGAIYQYIAPADKKRKSNKKKRTKAVKSEKTQKLLKKLES